MQNCKTIIQQQLQSYSSEDRRLKSEKYFTTSMKVLGVSVPDEKKIIKTIKPQWKQLTKEEKLQLCHSLYQDKIFEHQHLALLLIADDKNFHHSLSKQEIFSFNQQMDNWCSVDTYGVYLIGRAWNNNIIEKKDLQGFVSNPDVWQRRIALVATVALNQKSQGGKGDTATTLEFCSLFVTDKHDMIVKALSWSLRELSKRDKHAVEEFMQQHENSLHNRMKREVWHKIEKGTKN